MSLSHPRLSDRAPEGTVLFEPGMHPTARPIHRPYQQAGERAVRLHYSAGEEVSERLAALGRDPGEIDVSSTRICNSTCRRQRHDPTPRSWCSGGSGRPGMDPDVAAQRGFFRRDYDLGHKVQTNRREHDLFATAHRLPAERPHAGHQSLKLRLDSDHGGPAGGGEVVLAADACSFCRSLRRAPPAARRIRPRRMRALTTASRARGRRRAPVLTATTPSSGRPCRRRRRRHLSVVRRG